MNRAVMLRIAACGIMGLGAALLIAALLLSTYTANRVNKIPLDIDATLPIGRLRATELTQLARCMQRLWDQASPVVPQSA